MDPTAPGDDEYPPPPRWPVVTAVVAVVALLAGTLFAFGRALGPRYEARAATAAGGGTVGDVEWRAWIGVDANAGPYLELVAGGERTRTGAFRDLQREEGLCCVEQLPAGGAVLIYGRVDPAARAVTATTADGGSSSMSIGRLGSAAFFYGPASAAPVTVVALDNSGSVLQRLACERTSARIPRCVPALADA